MGLIRINYGQLERLREYELKTRVPISRSVEEAVGSWLDCIAPTRLEALGLTPLTPPLRRSKRSEINIAKSNTTSCKASLSVVSQASFDGQLESWLCGVMRSHHDLLTVLERLRDSFKLSAQKPLTEADHAILVAVQNTLSSAKNARAL
jgi:Ribbon-helix-helix domain